MTCAGYGIGLVWPGDKERRGGGHCRMLLETPTAHCTLRWNETEVDAALEAIDTPCDDASRTVGLFSVFRITLSSADSRSLKCRSSPKSSNVEADEDSSHSVINDWGVANYDLSPRLANNETTYEREETLNQQTSPDPATETTKDVSEQQLESHKSRPSHSYNAPNDPWFSTYAEDLDMPNDPAFLNYQEWPLTQQSGCDMMTAQCSPLYPSIDAFSFVTQSQKERQLMHYWVTFLGGLMTPTPRADNIFQDIFTSLALLAMTSSQNAPAHLAFLHSLYAFAAYSYTRIHGPSLFGVDVGGRHVEKSLQLLKRGLTSTSSSSLLEEQQATLATIYTLSVIPAFTGESSDWRVHLRGGMAWIRATDKSAWKYSRTTSTLYQALLCLETLRPAQKNVAKDLRPNRLSLWHPGLELEVLEQSVSTGSVERHEDGFKGMDWYLSDILGVTRPILETIQEINQWLFSGHSPPSTELDRLELQLYRNDPATNSKQFQGPDERCRELALHHARAFYYACHVYLACALRKQSSSHRRVASLVRQSIHHIEAFGVLEQDLNVSGLMWPAFITACEAEDIDMRLGIMKYFDKRECWGIANVTKAKEVVLGVWKRKDENRGQTGNYFVSWHDVMADMGADIILS